MRRRSQRLKFFQRLLYVYWGIALVTMSAWIHEPALSYRLEQPYITERTSSPIALVAAQTSAQVQSVDALIDQGRQHYKAQRFTSAINDWSQASEVLATQNQPAQQALLHSYMTTAYQALGQWENAETNILHSLDLLAVASVPPQISAQIYNTFGSLQFATGRIQSALETWQQAETLYLQNGDELRYFNNLLNQIQAQQTLGFYHQVADTLRTLEGLLPQQPLPVQVIGYQQLGKTYRLIGDLDTSQRHLETALALTGGLETPVATGAILIGLGNTAQAKGNVSEAIAHYQQAITEASQADLSLKARLNLLQVLANNDPIAARQTIPLLTTEMEGTPLGRSQIYAYIHAAQSLLVLGTSTDIETAASWLAQALQQSVVLQDRRAESYARGYLAQAYARSHQWTEAQALTETALTTAQTLNAADISYQWQWQLGRLFKQQNNLEAALSAYRDAFASLQSIHQDLSATHQDLQFSFRDQVEPIYRELVDLLLRPAQQDASLSSETVVARREEARQVIEALQVAELDNFFRTACLDAQKVALEEVAETDAAVVYPIILSDRIEMLVSLPGQPLKQYTTVVAQSQLEATLTDWRKNLEKPFTTPEGKALGNTLYDLLIEPMQSALVTADVKTLVFVLDGVLRNVPMAAIYHDDRYLIEDYAIALSPGLQLLGPRALQSTRSTALLAGLSQARHGFSALTYVENELRAAQSLVDGSLLFNEDFTTGRLAEQISKANQPIVHLATHGQFSSKVDETFILAWDRPIPVVEMSELLKAGDLNRPDPIELLILSACETATGDTRAALGLAGVALQSGTRSTLASLWTVDDASSAAFVDQFYQHLGQPDTSKADALRQAQLFLLKNPDYRHPTYWSAYVLVGNWL
ncbi:MAG: CHAT domain-containing protein [Cyanobacteria bacterium J06627_28]